MYISSVGWGARDPRYFRFALRSPDGAISGQKGFFWAVFWVFRLPEKQDVSGKGAKQDGSPSSHRYFVLIYNRSHRGTFANL